MASFHYQHLYSTSAGNQPALENLLRGELAINLADGVIFYRKVTDAAQEQTDTIASFSIEGTLSSLKDLNISSPAAGQALVYDASTSEWKNTTLTASNISDFQTQVQSIIAGQVGSTVQAHNANLDELSKLDTEGYVYRKADGTYTEMTVSGVDGQAVVTNTPDSGTIKVGLATVGTAGTYTKVTTDAYGRVTSGTNPTTVDGYGITDALKTTGGTMTGALKVLDPVADDDAVNKKYADSVALGYTFHVSCATGTNTNLAGTYADGSGESKGVGATFTLTADTGNTTQIGGLVLRQDMRVMLLNQTDAKQNGCYVVTTFPAEATGQVVLTRADDFDGDPEITYKGATFLITHGDLKGTSWRLMNEGGITFGTDEIEFVQISAPNEYTGGAGIEVSGNTIAVKQGATVQVVGGNLEVASGTGNNGKFLQAQGDGSAATWAEVDLSNYVTLDGAQTITGVKTFQAAPVSTAAQTLESDGTQLAKVATVNEAVTYTDESTNGATVTVGGINKGDKLEDMSVLEVIDKLLHPYVATTGVGLTTTPAAGVFEVGDTKQVTSATVRWTAGSTQVTKAEVLLGGVAIGTAEVQSGGSVAVTVTTDAIGSAAGTTTYTARVTDNNGTKTITGGSQAFTFVYPFYYGSVASAAEATGTAVAGMTKLVQTKGTKSVTYTHTNQCCVFAYPQSYGALTKITDPNGFTITDTFAQKTETVNGQQYYVYTNAAATLNGFKITFAF